MGLKYRKRINNGLPCYEGGTENILQTSGFGGLAAAMPWILLGQMAGSGAAEGINAIRNSDQILSDAGTSEASVNGISYQTINNVGSMKDYDRELGTSFLTNPFKGLTMLFGRRAQKRNLQRARTLRTAINQSNMAGAATNYLQLDYELRYGNNDSILYAKNGKDVVETSVGPISAIPNSKTEGGEIIYNQNNGTAHEISGKPNGDNHLSSILSSDTIITNKFGLADKARKAARTLESLNRSKKNRGQFAKLTDTLMKNQALSVLNNVAKELRLLRNIGMLPLPKLGKYDDGFDATIVPDMSLIKPSPIEIQYGAFTDPETGLRFFNKLPSVIVKPTKLPESPKYNPELPKFDPDDKYALTVDKKGHFKPAIRKGNQRKFPSNWWIDGLGALTGLGLTIGAAMQKPKRSNTYAANPYEGNAINGLLGLNINPYPILKDMYDQQNRNLYAINRAGGLSGAQKAYANVASGIGMQNAIAKLEADIQSKNNAYKSNAYTAMINAGQADRQARMAANQWDLDYYSKSHAAKQQMIEQGLYNSLAALQQGYKNSFNRYEFDKIMNRYSA